MEEIDFISGNGMVKLYAVVPVYQAEETIYECLSALSKFCDVIIVREGKWIGYEGPLHSTDRTIEEVFRFIRENDSQCQVDFGLNAKEYNQYEVRNILISQVPIGDWYIWIDSDEIVKVYPTRERVQELISADVDGYQTYAYEENSKEPSLLNNTRMLRMTKGQHYTLNHRYLDDDKGPIVFGGPRQPPLKEIIHFHKTSKVMRSKAEEYKKWLNEFENNEC
jgi:hypothetical protein